MIVPSTWLVTCVLGGAEDLFPNMVSKWSPHLAYVIFCINVYNIFSFNVNCCANKKLHLCRKFKWIRKLCTKRKHGQCHFFFYPTFDEIFFTVWPAPLNGSQYPHVVSSMHNCTNQIFPCTAIPFLLSLAEVSINTADCYGYRLSAVREAIK